MYALLESSFAVLLSVLSLILMLFVLTAGATDLARVIAWAGIALTPILTLVAHAQLIGSFRRRPAGAPTRPGGLSLPLLGALVFMTSLALVQVVGSASWVSFARTYLTYALAPPAALGLASRVMLIRSFRQASGAPAP